MLHSKQTTMVNFRPKAAQQIANWITDAKCGLLIGLPSTGATRLLADVARQPQTLRPHLVPEVELVVPLLFSSTVAPDVATFWQALLRTLAEAQLHLPPDLQERRNTYETDLDAFAAERLARQQIERLCQPSIRLVVIIERFDQFCRGGCDEVADALYQLHTRFSSHLSILGGMYRETSCYFGDSRLHELFVGQRFWLGGISNATPVANMLSSRLSTQDHSPTIIDELTELSGGFPALVNTFVDWWQNTNWAWVATDWKSALYQYPAVQIELQRIWDTLTEHERSVLSDLELVTAKRYTKFEEKYRHCLRDFGRRGLCVYRHGRWFIFSELFARFIRDSRHTVRGDIWFNKKDDTFYQGTRPLDDLSPRAEAALTYFLAHPYKKCEKDQIIAHIWETPYVTDDSVYQVIRELRRTLEPDTRNPCYIINHRGLRGGRYQFFPEGRPMSRPVQ